MGRGDIARLKHILELDLALAVADEPFHRGACGWRGRIVGTKGEKLGRAHRKGVLLVQNLADRGSIQTSEMEELFGRNCSATRFDPASPVGS